MNVRERIYTVLNGKIPDQVPFTVYQGLFPKGDESTQERLRSLGLGILVVQGTSTIKHPNVEVEEQTVEERGLKIITRTYRTPIGEIHQKIRTESGYGSSWTIEHLVKEVKDYEVLEFIIRDTVYEPYYEGFEKAQEDLGGEGLVITSLERVPIQKLWIQYTGIERLSIDLAENHSVVEGVLDAIAAKHRELAEIVANSPAEFVWCPDNITGEVTGPPLFERYCVPYYDEVAQLMHLKGKRLLVHMDGMMRRLIDLVGSINIDVVEAFTPPPDGDLPLAEALRAWEDKVIWINFPSSLHIASTEKIHTRTLELLREAAPVGRFLVGVTENIPHNVGSRSLMAIAEAINDYSN